MLRLSIHPLTQSVLLLAQTRDRNGHVVDAVDVSDSATYGTDETLGFASQATGEKFPLVDIDLDGTFDWILSENDIDTTPALPGFYQQAMELSDPDNGISRAPWVADPNDATQTLWLYLGSEFTFDSVYFEIATAGSWTSAVLEVQYWDGTAWVGVTGLTEGSLLDTFAGASDQVYWTLPSDWFPVSPENQLITIEGQRRRACSSMFFIRMRLKTFVGLVSLPTISGIWKGWSAAEVDTTLWQNVIRPQKSVLVLGSMQRDANPHLGQVKVATRKQPAQRDTGLMDFGAGDYWLKIPTCGQSDEIISDPSIFDYRTHALDKSNSTVDFQVPSSGVSLSKGRYRARVIAEIPNVDFSQIATDTGHEIPPGTSGTSEFDAANPDPDDPEAQFDPTWRPMLTSVVGHFDVRDRDAVVTVSRERTTAGNDMYSISVTIDGKVVPLLNQGGTNPYARLRVIENDTQTVLIDTMDVAKSLGGAAIEPSVGVGGIDSDQFLYLETAAGRKLSTGVQYLVDAQVILGGEVLSGRTYLNT